jgi:hypothetical protein
VLASDLSIGQSKFTHDQETTIELLLAQCGPIGCAEANDLPKRKIIIAKAQDRYVSTVNKKRREITFQVGENVWLDSMNLRIPTELSIKWSAR